MGAAVTRALVAILALLALAALHLGLAREGPGLADLAAWLAGCVGVGDGVPAVDAFVLGDIRLPRLLVALCGGAALALAGAVMQATFRNPLASPDLVGTSAGAAFELPLCLQEEF